VDRTARTGKAPVSPGERGHREINAEAAEPPQPPTIDGIGEAGGELVAARSTQHLGQVERRGQGEEEPVESVEQTTVAG
jgi:hypothetical protein